VNICEICGNTPAAEIKLKRNVGLVVAHRKITARAVLCATCAEKATKEFQRETLIKGWTSPRSALSNPGTTAANAIRKKRHEKRLSAQPENQGSRNIRSTEVLRQMSTSDLFIALGEVEGTHSQILRDMILDLQGGAITSNSKQVDAICKPLAREALQEVTEVADSFIEGIQAAQGNNQLEGFVYGILSTGLWDFLRMSHDDVTDAHRALTEANFSASMTLLRSNETELARSILMLGLKLYVNTNAWLSAK
jgi:hypothetical protein